MFTCRKGERFGAYVIKVSQGNRDDGGILKDDRSFLIIRARSSCRDTNLGAQHVAVSGLARS
jgi:hypothetical protein